MDSNLKNVKDFIAKERWEDESSLTEKTSLQKDLKIYGDEASDFLLKFCNRFNIDYSQFDFDSYFMPEPSWIDCLDIGDEYKDFTIANLVKSIEEGKLIGD